MTDSKWNGYFHNSWLNANDNGDKSNENDEKSWKIFVDRKKKVKYV